MDDMCHGIKKHHMIISPGEVIVVNPRFQILKKRINLTNKKVIYSGGIKLN